MLSTFDLGHWALLVAVDSGTRTAGTAAAATNARDAEAWQTPIALLIVTAAALALLYGAWQKRRRPGSSCGSAGEGCGCSAVKKSLRK